MSGNYMRRGTVTYKDITPSTAGVHALIGDADAWMLYGALITVQTAGSQAGHKLQLLDSSDALIAEVTIGTTTAGLTKKITVPVASREIAAADFVKLKSVTNDATAVYDVIVIRSLPLE